MNYWMRFFVFDGSEDHEAKKQTKKKDVKKIPNFKNRGKQRRRKRHNLKTRSRGPNECEELSDTAANSERSSYLSLRCLD